MLATGGRAVIGERMPAYPALGEPRSDRVTVIAGLLERDQVDIAVGGQPLEIGDDLGLPEGLGSPVIGDVDDTGPLRRLHARLHFGKTGGLPLAAMCGIGGICSVDGAPVDRQVLKRMADSIAHRGPDAEGYYVNEGPPSVGLASRRLAVIDIEGGDQPLSIESGAFTIVYNGEVFNAWELRRELEGRGHRFETRSDTEVVVRGYAEWGTNVLDRLNGMWAFAIWDAPRRRLFIARDRLGVEAARLFGYGQWPGVRLGDQGACRVGAGRSATRPVRAPPLPLLLRHPGALQPHRRGKATSGGARAPDRRRWRQRVPILGLRPRRRTTGMAPPTRIRSRSFSRTPSRGDWSATSRSASCSRAGSTQGW